MKFKFWCKTSYFFSVLDYQFLSQDFDSLFENGWVYSIVGDDVWGRELSTGLTYHYGSYEYTNFHHGLGYIEGAYENGGFEGCPAGVARASMGSALNS